MEMTSSKSERMGYAVLIIAVLTFMGVAAYFHAPSGNSSDQSQFEPYYSNAGLLIEDTNGYGLLIVCPHGQEEYTERGGIGFLGVSGIYQLKVVDKGLIIAEANIYVPADYKIGVNISPDGIITPRIKD